MAWAGSGVLWQMGQGIARGQTLGNDIEGRMPTGSGLNFVQISDSHIGFNAPANTDVAATLQETVNLINALATPPAFLLHTGDITHLSKPEEFDTAAEILKSAKAEIFYVPGEHDIMDSGARGYLDRYGKATQGDGWYSFDHSGVHFIGLVNVKLRTAGFGRLGPDQLDWLRRDLENKTASTPIVVFAHMPLWTVYEQWGWGTSDGVEALQLLQRFGSVSILNGHIHQIVQKVEGSLLFHTARSTAFPQPTPGAASGPGPMVVPSERLKSMLGLTKIGYVAGKSPLAVVEESLA
jgi:3',5'-cyclic-AMP phosphodiesterase